MTPRTVFRSALPVALVATFLAAACGDDDAGSGDGGGTTAAPSATTAVAATAAETTVVEITVAPDMDPLNGTSWTLDTASLIDVEGADSVVASINFAGGQVSGSSGCNT